MRALPSLWPSWKVTRRPEGEQPVPAEPPHPGYFPFQPKGCWLETPPTLPPPSLVTSSP